MKVSKKILAVVISLAVGAAVLVGAEIFIHSAQSVEGAENDNATRFELVCELNASDAIYQDTQTGVLYWQKDVGRSAGITVLVDKDGKPLTLESLNEKSR